MRGSQSIYQELIDREVRNNRRGRSADLLAKRNELILHRYYYYIILQKRQYVDTLQQLEQEHFLSVNTIANIIMSLHAELKEIHTARPDARALRLRWPWVVW